MIVYANLTGQWIELGDNDLIEDEPAEIYINDNFLKSDIYKTKDFCKVSHKDLIYSIHFSQIQWTNDRY